MDNNRSQTIDHTSPILVQYIAAVSVIRKTEEHPMLRYSHHKQSGDLLFVDTIEFTRSSIREGDSYRKRT